MRKYIVACLIILSFLSESMAQEGVFAIARYDSAAPPKFNYKDSLNEFTGGFEAFKSVFLKEFKMPTEALRVIKAPDGMAGFTVNLVGKIVDIEILDSTHAKIDAEVVRVLSEISEFHPQPQPLKFAISYNVYPDWFRDFVAETEQAQKEQLRASKTDSLLKNTKLEDLLKAVNKKKAYTSGSFWVGFTTFNDPLSKYLKPIWAFGGDLCFFKNNWFGGGNLQFRGVRNRQDFEYKDSYWAKDTSIRFLSFGLMAGYQLIDEERLAFTPFVSIGAALMSLPTIEGEVSPEGSDIGSFAPSFGFLMDYKYKIRAKRMWIEPKLNTRSVRLRLAISPMNFKDGRKGNIVDLGIGLGFMQQSLKLN